MEVGRLYGALRRYGPAIRSEEELEKLFQHVLILIKDAKQDGNSARYTVIDKNENEWEVSIKKK